MTVQFIDLSLHLALLVLYLVCNTFLLLLEPDGKTLVYFLAFTFLILFFFLSLSSPAAARPPKTQHI